jgi:hypothetical protein
MRPPTLSVPIELLSYNVCQFNVLGSFIPTKLRLST